MVVGRLLRLSGHGEHDDASYVPDTVKAGEYGHDCLVLAKKEILDRGWASEDEIEEIVSVSQNQVEQAVAQAQSEDGPSPVTDDWRAVSSEALVEGIGER